AALPTGPRVGVRPPGDLRGDLGPRLDGLRRELRTGPLDETGEELGVPETALRQVRRLIVRVHALGRLVVLLLLGWAGLGVEADAERVLRLRGRAQLGEELADEVVVAVPEAVEQVLGVVLLLVVLLASHADARARGNAVVLHPCHERGRLVLSGRGVGRIGVEGGAVGRTAAHVAAD